MKLIIVQSRDFVPLTDDLIDKQIGVSGPVSFNTVQWSVYNNVLLNLARGMIFILGVKYMYLATDSLKYNRMFTKQIRRYE